MRSPVVSLLLALLLLPPAALAQDAKVHYDAGMAHLQDGDCPAAIAELTQAIRLDPQMAVAWKDRGRCRYLLEDAEGAVADYTRALELDPTFKMVYNNRGAARRTLDDLPGGLADLDRAIELDPEFDFAFLNRGLTRLLAGDSAGGRADVARGLELGTQYVDYPQLWLWTDRVAAGESDAAKALEAHVAARGEEIGEWEGTLMSFLLGRSDEAALLAAVEGAEPPDRSGRACEANFYAGMVRWAKGDAAGARSLLEKSVATSRWTFAEYAFARRMLRRLDEKE